MPKRYLPESLQSLLSEDGVIGTDTPLNDVPVDNLHWIKNYLTEQREEILARPQSKVKGRKAEVHELDPDDRDEYETYTVALQAVEAELADEAAYQEEQHSLAFCGASEGILKERV